VGRLLLLALPALRGGGLLSVLLLVDLRKLLELADQFIIISKLEGAARALE
jgi:hypothetical protein